MSLIVDELSVAVSHGCGTITLKFVVAVIEEDMPEHVTDWSICTL